MADKSAQQLLSRFEKISQRRSNFESVWQEISDTMIGRRDFVTQRSPGTKRTARIYDGTARVNGSLLVGGLHSLLTNPASRFVRVQLTDRNLLELADVAEFEEEVNDRFFRAISRPRARLHTQLNESYYDLVYFGTCGMWVEDVPGEGLLFSNRPLSELYLAEDAAGNVDTVIRRFQMTNRQAWLRYGSRVPDEIAKAMERGESEDQSWWLQFLMPNDRSVPEPLRNATDKAVLSVILHVATAQIVSTGGFEEMPIAVARWATESGEVYGRGPGWEALSDAIMANEMKRVKLRGAQKAVSPPMLVDSEGVLGSIHLEPDGINVVNAITSAMNPPLQPMRFDFSGFPIHQLEVSETRQQVKEAFLHQLLELIRSPNMTATQVLELTNLVQRHLAHVMARIQTELLDPVMTRALNIEFRAGRMPEVPQAISGADVSFEYTSPLIRAQRASDAKAMIDFLSIMGNAAQVTPEVLDNIDSDRFTRELASFFDLPASTLRTPDEVEERRKVRAEMARQQAELQQQVLAADIQVKRAAALKAESAATQEATNPQ